MKKYRYSIALVAMMLFSLPACRKFIDIPESASFRMPTVNYIGYTGALLPGEERMPMTISRTSRSAPTSIDDATAEIRINGVLAEAVGATTTYASRKAYPITVSFAPGQEVELKTKLADGRVLSAKQTVPQVPTLDALTMTREKESGSGDHYVASHYLVRVNVKDTNKDRNYYRLSFFIRYRYQDETDGSISYDDYIKVKEEYKNDLILNDGKINSRGKDELGLEELLSNSGKSNDFLAFSDRLFEGGVGEIKVQLFTGFSHLGTPTSYRKPDGTSGLRRATHTELAVGLEGLTREAYLYYRTLGAQKVFYAENPFASPVQIYSNVSGGAGIFTVVSRTLKTVTLEDK